MKKFREIIGKKKTKTEQPEQSNRGMMQLTYLAVFAFAALIFYEGWFLAVRREAGKNPGSVQIVKQFAAEFQVQLVAELGDPLPDVLGLHGSVFVVVKSDSCHEDLLIFAYGFQFRYSDITEYGEQPCPCRFAAGCGRRLRPL